MKRRTMKGDGEKVEAKIVGQKIAELRKKNNMTQKDLAVRLNVIDKTVSRWECGYGLPEVTLLPRIAAVFNVSIEELIGESAPAVFNAGADGESLLSDATLAEKAENRSRTVALRVAVALLIVSVVAGLVAVVFTALFPRVKTPKIVGLCWERVQKSDADDVFFTAFGQEECMSLELRRGKTETDGTFFCQETWRESLSGDLFNCAAYGKYEIADQTVYFYPEGIVDPDEKQKLYTHTALGIDNFHASLAFDESGRIEAVVFNAVAKNSDTSVFGRWTKFANYFSRSKGEVYFERISGEFRYDQYLRCPEYALVSMQAAVPYKLEVALDRYEYYVGEIIAPEDIDVSLVFADGGRHRVENIVCEQAGRELTASDEYLNVYYTDENVKKTVTVNISVRYGYAWERAKASRADFVYFTHYNTGKSISFGTLELIGSQQAGRFIYSENYGETRFSNAAVVTGVYERAGNELRLVSTSVLSFRNYLSRFYVNAEGDYFSAYVQDDLSFVAFYTGEYARNLFGHYTVLPNETSFSAASGEVEFERVKGGVLSQRAVAAVERYKDMCQ